MLFPSILDCEILCYAKIPFLFILGIMNTRGGNMSHGSNVPRRPRTGVLGGFQQLAAILRHAFPRNSGQSRTYVEIARSHGVTKKVEDVFEVMHCPVEERAKTAGYFL